MDSQFLHVNLYGRKPRPKAKRHELATAILNEAERLPSSTGHLAQPRPPRQLVGAAPTAISKAVKRLSQAARDSRGRKLRSDANLVMCLVASFPRPETELAADDSGYQSWATLTLDWLHRTFGENLAGAVEHRDETFRHIHAFVLPPLGENGRLEWNAVHPGRRAKMLAAARGASKNDQDEAYISAMQAFQDDFFDSVSRHFGHARLTVQRERRGRAEHLLIRELQLENARLVEQIQSMTRRLEALTKDDDGPVREPWVSPSASKERPPAEWDITFPYEEQYDAEFRAETAESSPHDSDREDDDIPDEHVSSDEPVDVEELIEDEWDGEDVLDWSDQRDD